MASLKDKRLFLLDMDGTLYLDEHLFDKVPEFLNLIRHQGGRYLFLTNNSSRGVEGYIAKMRRLGIETAPEDYMTSADAAEHTLPQSGTEPYHVGHTQSGLVASHATPRFSRMQLSSSF